MAEATDPPAQEESALAEYPEYEALPELNQAFPNPEPAEGAAPAEPDQPVSKETVASPASSQTLSLMLGLALMLVGAGAVLLLFYDFSLQARLHDATTQLAQAKLRLAALPSGDLVIISAVYGSGSRFADVTGKVKEMLAHPDAKYYAHPQWLGTDPTPGWNKQLLIVYEFKGVRYLFSTGEGGKTSVPVLLEQVTN